LPASRTGNLQKWNNISSTVTLYIDEKWDIDQKLSGDRNLWGTIAAVAWADNAPRPRELPKISLPARGHVRSLGGMGTHMKDLFACSSAFPILLPIFTKNALQPDTYKKVLGLSLQLILGWILPKPSSPRTCNIFLEHYSGFERGTEKTEYFEGLFEGLQLLNPARFSCWKLGRVEWRSKDHGYIPYADILAYCMGKSEIARSLREKFDVEKMKGYVPFHQDLIPMLLRLENIETAHNVADILDLSRDLHGTALLHTLLQDLKRRLIHKTEIHRKLYEELDARYLKKERDLRELRLQLHTINVLTGELPKDAPLSLRMMEIAVKLQSANHEGDPYRYRETVDQYTSLLNRARENGLHELAAHCELNRAVRLSDQFRTAEALALVEKMKKMGYLSLGTLGKVWSSCGQYLSMMGDYRQAEGAFGKALELFKNAEYTTEEERKAEHDQTSVYRAINALDGGFTSAHEYLENVLRDLPTAAKNLAVAAPQKNPFHHHLFLRAIWWSKNLCAEARLEYLNRYQRWQTGEQHPWELIEMYRGLLLKGTRKTEGAECFERAISVALLDSHGPTLRLSAAMIAVAGYCCYKRESFKNRALALLGETEPLIPHAAPMIQALRHLCRNPGEDKISQVLKLFPFNFH
jgi:tetratricopeptide (TPR) repeat protein